MAKNTLNANDDLTQIKFTALLKTAVHNKRLNYIEKRNTRLKRQLDFEDFESSLCDPDDFIQTIVDGDILKVAMERLNEREREVFYSRLIEDKSFFEISEDFGLSYKTTAAIFYRGIKKMRDFIRSIDDEF